MAKKTGNFSGVSGHAFIGADPFLTLAGMSDNKLSSYLSYAASTLAGLARINDNAHFPSQIFLEWFMAFEATGSVLESEKQGEIGGEKIRYSIIPSNDGCCCPIGLAALVTEKQALPEAPETKWWVPGIGVVQGITKGEFFALVATTFVAQ